ncbi:hypothetical protein KKHLCK_06475 [Candidatus Electrothrix laxa]
MQEAPLVDEQVGLLEQGAAEQAVLPELLPEAEEALPVKDEPVQNAEPAAEMGPAAVSKRSEGDNAVNQEQDADPGVLAEETAE